MNTKANLANLEELRKAIEESILIALIKLGDKAKELDWFAGNEESND